MHQLTLISLYGDKAKEFKELVNMVWDSVARSRLRRFFRPYDIRQIHGTLVGMEKLPGYRAPYNRNIRQRSAKLTTMTFDALSATVSERVPITCQIGGFAPDFGGFLSFGQKPYLRSFQIQWATRKVTMIGWPFHTQQGKRSYSERPLFNLRNALAERCNIEHKYPPPRNEDNDLFMVIGELVDLQTTTESEMHELQTSVTDDLAKPVRDMLLASQIDVGVTKETVFVARYTKETLPLDSTEVYCLDDPSVDGAFVAGLY